MRALLVSLLLLPLSVPAQRPVDFKGRPAVLVSNDKVELTILMNGGTLASLLLRDGAEPLSPLAATGHFLCLDGFGAPSGQEQAAGMPFHGEASKQIWKMVVSQPFGNPRSLTLSTWLPLAQENFTRTFQIVDGENVIYVESALETPLAFDRPISWAEHVTLGPPFLENGKVVVDMSAAQCRVRAQNLGRSLGRLIPLRDFTWPMAPTRSGGQADLRRTPTDLKCMDLAGCQMDPTRRLAFVSALHLEKRLLFGYVFRREEYPWIVNWMNYTGDAEAKRGMEFSTQPFDISRREAVEAHSLFGTPTFRWLPAKSRIQSRFLLFYVQAPEGFSRVDDITLDGGKLTIEDRLSGKRIVLAASLPL